MRRNTRGGLGFVVLFLIVLLTVSGLSWPWVLFGVVVGCALVTRIVRE